MRLTLKVTTAEIEEKTAACSFSLQMTEAALQHPFFFGILGLPRIFIWCTELFIVSIIIGVLVVVKSCSFYSRI